MILSPEDLELLTKRRKPAWQRRELDHLRIPYKPRSDGSLIVFWEDVRATHNVQPKEREPELRLPA